MPFENYKFEVTEQHIKLLRRANVSWEGSEFGAPSIDCKRPYGSSDVYGDIAEILDMPISDEGFSDGEKTTMHILHEETKTALQIFLATGEMKAGKYEAERYTNDWKLAI